MIRFCSGEVMDTSFLHKFQITNYTFSCKVGRYSAREQSTLFLRNLKIHFRFYKLSPKYIILNLVQIPLLCYPLIHTFVDEVQSPVRYSDQTFVFSSLSPHLYCSHCLP